MGENIKKVKSNLPEVVFTFPNCMGGVASFNRNIINNSTYKENCRCKVILIDCIEDERARFEDFIDADEVQVFRYSNYDNKYHTANRLSKLLGNRPGVVVTDNALTLESMYISGSKKTSFYLVHDFFYVKQSIGYENIIDVIVGHSKFFCDAMFASNPKFTIGKNFHIPYGVECLKSIPEKGEDVLNLVFLGRLTKGKGVLELKEIDEILQNNGITAHWTIIGKGPLESELKDQWIGHQHVTFQQPAKTSDVYELLSKQDILVLPTSFEGTPVSIIECMANGIIPVVSDLPGGIREIISSEIGYRCKLHDPESFAMNIVELQKDPEKLATLRRNCFDLALNNYDILKNANNYFKLFLEPMHIPRNDENVVLQWSMLDKKFLPNILVRFLRKVISVIK